MKVEIQQQEFGDWLELWNGPGEAISLRIVSGDEQEEDRGVVVSASELLAAVEALIRTMDRS